MAIVPESLRTAMAMAVRFGAPHSHALALLRCPFGIPFHNRVSPRSTWLKSLLHSTPTSLSKPSHALPVESSLQETVAKPVTKSPGFDLAYEALDLTKRSPDSKEDNYSSQEAELEEGECKHRLYNLLYAVRNCGITLHVSSLARFMLVTGRLRVGQLIYVSFVSGACLCPVPEQLREDLESTAWSVGLDGFNVGMTMLVLQK